MSLSATLNIMTMIFCFAVLVQSLRMMRSLRTVKDGALTQVVQVLEKATADARAVLFDMKMTLERDGAENARAIEQGRALRDELLTIVPLADAAAERIVNTVAIANEHRARIAGAIGADEADEAEAA